MLAWVCQDRQLLRQGLAAIADEADTVWLQQRDNMAIQRYGQCFIQFLITLQRTLRNVTALAKNEVQRDEADRQEDQDVITGELF